MILFWKSNFDVFSLFLQFSAYSTYGNGAMYIVHINTYIKISLDNFSQFVYGTHPCTYVHCARSAFSNFMVINQIVHNAYHRSARISLNNNPYSRSDFCALNSPRAFFLRSFILHLQPILFLAMNQNLCSV